MPESRTIAAAPTSLLTPAVLAALVSLTACEPVFMMEGTVIDGVLEGSHETFVGTAVAIWPNKPTLQLITTTGARCVGDINTLSAQEGRGHLHCSDGRRGAFGIVSTSYSGAAGFGDLGGKRIGFVVKYSY
jgi:hypothetical protein